MGRSAKSGWVALLVGATVVLSLARADAQKKPKEYRLPLVDLKQQVIWGASCDGPDGTGLAFGGEDQKADDGRPHTRVKSNGQWQAIHGELRGKNPLQKYHERCGAVRQLQKDAAAKARFIYFQGLADDEQAKRVQAVLLPLQEKVDRELAAFSAGLAKAAAGLKDYEAGQTKAAQKEVRAAAKLCNSVTKNLMTGLAPPIIEDMGLAQVALELAAECLDAEPPPRTLSPLVYDAKTKLYVLFGGDHFDYLTNDTWTFDPAKKTWTQRHSKAPLPRANHTLQAKDGMVRLSGGYTYTSRTNYEGYQYRDLDDGDWTYDIAADTWAGKGTAVPSNARVYRTGPFDPNFFLKGPKPDAAAFQKKLADLPGNTWVSTKPPHLPQLNRDWGTAVLDPDRDLILRWSGGHCAHGGTDVLHFHLASNRWELPFPVEFPLGELYVGRNIQGFNFNRRPWITGHTYQNYGYDPVFQKMLFTGEREHCYIYDPEIADWTGRFAKPKGMDYNTTFYTLTLCPTPQGLVCWTEHGRVFQFNSGKKQWVEIKLHGDKLPGSVVDRCTLVHDSKRDRLLFFRKAPGKEGKYDGRIYALDRKTGAVSTLSPKGMEAAAAFRYVCQIRYDSTHDLLLVGGSLPPGDDGVRRTPAYDCGTNAWVTLKLTGDDPGGKTAYDIVSLGMMYDARRQLFWAVDTRSNVFVLRLDPKTADRQPLR